MSELRQKPLCRHCGTRKVNRPRGLCWTCYYTPGVSDQYPTTSKHGRRQRDIEDETPPPAEPTTAPAGSLEKLKALRARVKAGTDLHHPQDSREIHHRDGPLFGKYNGDDDTGLED